MNKIAIASVIALTAMFSMGAHASTNYASLSPETSRAIGKSMSEASFQRFTSAMDALNKDRAPLRKVVHPKNFASIVVSPVEDTRGFNSRGTNTYDTPNARALGQMFRDLQSAPEVVAKLPYPDVCDKWVVSKAGQAPGGELIELDLICKTPNTPAKPKR